MSSNQIDLPNMDMWAAVTSSFRDRVSSPTRMISLRSCIEQRFMQVQGICCGVKSNIAHQSIENLVNDLRSSLAGFLEATELTFQAACFGRTSANLFGDHDFVGMWCLIMEFATAASPNATTELNLGCLSHGMELEFGSDCKKHERTECLSSPAFEFASRLLPVTRATDLRCPLGGAAIQLDILGSPPQSHLRVA